MSERVVDRQLLRDRTARRREHRAERGRAASRCAHGPRGRCADCRQARATGVSADTGGARRGLNFYGHHTYHAGLGRLRGGVAGPAIALASGGQRSGPITFGAPSFLTAQRSTNKFLGGNAQATIAVLT